MIKALNLYAGIGGNRKRWQNVQVTAVEYDAEIAAIYKEYFPQDEVVVADAHQYLLDHYTEYDFIWSSRPCITHTRSRFWNSKGGGCLPLYPDFGLYEEIVFLQHFFKGKYVVENVEPYYEPLIAPTVTIGRHFFWSNFRVRPFNHVEKNAGPTGIKGQEVYGFSLKGRKLANRKDQIIRNCVNPDIGLHILECAFPAGAPTVVPQGELF